MTNLNTKVETKRNSVVGTMNQAKGVAREKLGRATNNYQMEWGGKKDQVVGSLQRTVGNSWAFRKRNTLLAFAAIATVAAAVIYFFNRTNEMDETITQYSSTY